MRYKGLLNNSRQIIATNRIYIEVKTDINDIHDFTQL